MITIQGLQKKFGSVVALDSASVELPAGSITAILGPSGSGKTTLLRLLAGLETPTGGEIYLGGELASSPDWVRPPKQRGIGFVFQSPALWPHMTVAQNVAFGLLGRPRPEIRKRVAEILADMGLDNLEKRYPSQLSGGQARRVSLARTLVTSPQRLLLDEPLTHLDSALKDELLNLIIETAASQKLTLVYVTHNANEAERLNGRILILRNGCLADDSENAP